MDKIRNTSEYHIKVTVDSNYPYFAANRGYVKTWEDFVFNGKIKLIDKEEIVATVTFTAIPFHMTTREMQDHLFEYGGYSYLYGILQKPGAKKGFCINLSRLFVSPDYRNQGIGKSLLKNLPNILLQQIGWQVTLVTASPGAFEGTIDAFGSWTVDRCENIDSDELNDKLYKLYIECGFEQAKPPNTFLYHKIIK